MRLAMPTTSGGSVLPSTLSRVITVVNRVLLEGVLAPEPNMRSGPKVNTTSSAFISSPLWNFTPLRRDNSTVRSSMRRQLSASPGTGSSLPCRLRAMRFSKIGVCTRSPTLERSRTVSRLALVATCWTAMEITGRLSACPMAKRGSTRPPAARPPAVRSCRRSSRDMSSPRCKARPLPFLLGKSNGLSKDSVKQRGRRGTRCNYTPYMSLE